MRYILVFIFSCIYVAADAQQFQWAKRIGNVGRTTRITDMALDLSDNLWICGSFQGTVDFDPGPGSVNYVADPNDPEIFVAKYDPAGNYLWSMHIPGILTTSESVSIACDFTGHIILGGSFKGQNVDFDPGSGTQLHSSGSFSDMFLAKYDPSGNHVWSVTMTGNSIDAIMGIAVDNAGNIFTTGYYLSNYVVFPNNDTLDNASSPAYFDFFLAKFNTSGTCLWTKHSGGGYHDTGDGLTIDPFGNVYVIGTYTVNFDADFSPVATNILSTFSGTGGTFLAKYDTNGNHSWAFGLGAQGGSNNIMSIDTDNQGNIYAVGQFEETVDFNPSATTNALASPIGSYSSFAAKYDSSGNYQFAFRLAKGYCYDIHTMATGDFIMTGYFKNSYDFNLGSGSNILTNTGSSDCYTAAFTATGNFLWAFNIGGTNSLMDNCSGNRVMVDQSGAIYLGGIFSGGNTDFDPGTGNTNLDPVGMNDLFLARYAAPVGMHEINTSNSLHIFPNPSAPGTPVKVILDTDPVSGLLVVMNATSQVITEQPFNEINELYLDNSSWPAGLYLIVIKSDDGAFARKILILD